VSSGQTRRLAAFAADLDFDDVPPPVIEHAKSSVLDTLGCGLQGSTLAWSRIAAAVAAEEGGSPEATVWGAPQRASRLQAAWLNATAGHGFELDDVHMGGMIHPGSLTVSAAMSAGEPIGIDGRTLLAAVVAGCEVGSRVGEAVGTAHFFGGYHPQGTVGVFAAAAAAGRAIGLDADAMHQALGIAASHAAGLMGAQRGAMVKRLHSGHAAQSGVLSALLAARGFTGTADVLETDFGGFCSTLGRGETDLDRLTGGLGERWETGVVAFKPYPSCAAAQASIEAARILGTDHGLTADDVDTVTVSTSEHVRIHSGWPYEPEGVTAAQMSIGYGVAQMLMDGSLEARHFTAERIADPAVVELAGRVVVLADPDVDALGPSRRYKASVVLRTHDGRVLRHDIEDRPGNTSNPMTTDQLVAKFRGLAAPVIGQTAADELRGAVLRLDDAPSIVELTALLRTVPSDAPAPVVTA
jgi:2-methylcitrate dehydratase PrpD